MIKENLNQLLTKPMSRADFMKQIGIVFLLLTGITGAINLLAGQHASPAPRKSTAQVPTSYGYGSMAYGGVQR